MISLQLADLQTFKPDNMQSLISKYFFSLGVKLSMITNKFLQDQTLTLSYFIEKQLYTTSMSLVFMSSNIGNFFHPKLATMYI